MTAEPSPCVRCGLPRRHAACWPDGIVCGPCHKAAQRRIGSCTVCGRRRVLPGQRGHDLLCAPCFGIPGYVCATCGTDDEVLWGVRECLRCALRRRLNALLDDGTGTAPGFLTPLVDALCSAKNPSSTEAWLKSRVVCARLQALASGELALTHEALSALPPSSSVNYLRELLMSIGLLPARNPELLKFDQWSSTQLDQVEVKEDRQALATYIAWHHRRRILRHLDKGTLRPSAWSTARQQTRIAVTFLNWLKDRGLTLSECTQHDIDDWFASGPTTRLLARTFMTFAVRRRLCLNLRIPAPPKTAPDAQPQQEHIALIRRLFTDDTISAIDRVAGLLVLLYAQPTARITQLQLDDVTVSGDQVWLRIAEEQLPLPEPLDQLTIALITQRRNMGTAANPTSPWLFPGQRPNRPITASQLRNRLRGLGITRTSRTATFNQLLREIPAPVLADLVGCHPRFAAERATALATDWDNYAALRAAQHSPTGEVPASGSGAAHPPRRELHR